jgi:hypothetical protein
MLSSMNVNVQEKYPIVKSNAKSKDFKIQVNK